MMFVGYENCEIYRSDDAGEHWTRLPVGRALPRDHHRARRQSGQARADDGCQRQSAGPPVRGDRGRRHAPLHRRRRALGEPQPRPVPERRCGGHARRAGQPLAARHGDRHRPRRHVPQRRRRRSLAAREARCDERQGPDLLPRHPRGAGQSAQGVRRRRRQLPERHRRRCCTAATAATPGRTWIWA